MKRSIYSLVLMDNLVSEVDRLACANGTSRSNMVNRILAEYLSLSTPERQMQDIFTRMEQLISTCRNLQATSNPSERALSMKTVLSYKYNPTVRYNLVLYRNAGISFGELRVLFRTQNAAFLDAIMQFFILWAKLEKHYRPHENLSFKIEEGKMIRKLNVIGGATHDELGDAAVAYVEFFDLAIKCFFENLTSPSRAAVEVERIYCNYLKSNTRRV